jgi:alkyldihydroxyacetonephosphate synthase
MMKWWGWGDPRFSFPMQNKPELWPWIKKTLKMTEETLTPPVARESITLNPPVLNDAFIQALSSFLKSDQLTFDDDERLLHSYGKSYPDLFRVRRGVVLRAPDLVLLPERHEDVEAIVRIAHEMNVCLIPFGGGTNIVGGVNPEDNAGRTVASLDMRRMNRLISVDFYSRTATIQAGALGPKLEADLAEKGYSLGHYPDSFEYSTLGGWLATRSAGMQSDAYGKIEDMVVSLRMVTPSGTLTTRPTPASSAGPDLNQWAVGSEGVFGVITEATMRVHRSPPVKDYRGYLFPTFQDGVDAIQECLERGYIPSLIRLQDSGETELAFHMKTPKTGLAALIQKPIKAYLKRKGYTAPCIMVIGFEGDEDAVRPVRSGALRIVKAHKGFSLGAGVGKTWSADKFNVPYLRDFIMDYGCMADVSETAAVWSQVIPLYENTIRAVKEKFGTDRGSGYIGCHISHTYKTGACLYFTYASKQRAGQELEQYYEYKRLITDTFLKSGGTLSHHHAIGTEHRQWMEQEVSLTGLQALRAVKESLDPKGIFNPGKLIPETAPAANRGATKIHGSSSFTANTPSPLA